MTLPVPPQAVNTRKVATRASGRGGFLLAAAAGGLGLFAGGLALAAGVWLLPSLCAFWIERQPGRPMTRAMALFGLAVSLPALIVLWNMGGGQDAAFASLADPLATARSWCAQGAAWLLAELLPVLLVLRVEADGRRELLKLEDQRRALEQEWTVAS